MVVFELSAKTPNLFIKNRHFGLVDFTCFVKTPNQRGLKLDFPGEMVGDFSKTAKTPNLFIKNRHFGLVDFTCFVKTPNQRGLKLAFSGKMVG